MFHDTLDPQICTLFCKSVSLKLHFTNLGRRYVICSNFAFKRAPAAIQIMMLEK